MFRGLSLYAMVIILPIEWCIRKSKSYNTTSMNHNQYTDIHHYNNK